MYAAGSGGGRTFVASGETNIHIDNLRNLVESRDR